jgi:hypothetical protein
MPRKDGELTIGEIRELLKAHRKLSTMPPDKKLTRAELIDWAKKKGYDLDVKNGKIKKTRLYKRTVTLDVAKEVDKDKKAKAALKQNKKS